MIAKLLYYFQFPFVTYALIVGVLIAFCASLLGVTLVLKRYSYISDGLSHIAFAAMSIATVLKLSNQFSLMLPITLLSAILLLRSGDKNGIRADAAIAMLSVSALAIAYLLMNLFSAAANVSGDVCSTLFGATTILTLTLRDVWISVALTLLVLVIFLLFYHQFFAITFDESFTTAVGMRSAVYKLLIALIIALVIVLAMNLVGSLLISALVIFPALAAMRVCRSFRSVTICSVIFSVVCASLGILLSILAGTPVGSTIVVTDLLGFALFALIGGILQRRAVHP